ncbi:alpha/beta hydrolase, partial [Aquicoccus sp.]|uniref:alpha/beta hydrolase n=1 Tax=Aquicoccus sp. TaxID=2055851 RepID=UPI003566390A
INRWFRRYDAVTYDQADIRSEAEAFNGFMDAVIRSYGLDAGRISYLGYSNGANLLGALMLLHPGLVRRAILLRGIAALDDAPAPDLTGANILLLSGAHDPFARMAPALEASLRSAGATLDTRTLPVGHELGASDLDAAKSWLDRQTAK